MVEFDSGGEMGARMRAKDWSETPLGPLGSWSPALRMMTSFLLANRFPMLLWWGPEFISIYNDAYRPVLGKKHPRALGLSVWECWSEIWPILKPLILTPFQGGPATWSDDLQLELHRHGFVEETHFTVAYSPVPDADAPSGIGGVLATVHEITAQVLGERRVSALRDLGARASEAKTASEACVTAAEAFAHHPKDVPFALIYLVGADGRAARLASAAGIAMGTGASPLEIDLWDVGAAWPLGAVVQSGRVRLVEDLRGRFGPEVPPGPWDDPPSRAIVAPIVANRPRGVAAVLVAGASVRVALDDQYRAFFDFAAAQLGTSIANAEAREHERRRAEELAELDHAKTLFFSNVSHEFRTPLTLLLGPLDELAAGAKEGERELLDVARRNAQRLLKLANTLLDFSRIEAGRIQASYEPTDLAAFTADLASAFRAAVERAGMKLHVDCAPLPEPVFVDHDMWEKIVLNLVSNAFKYTLAGELRVSLRAEAGAAVLAVADTGIGIPAPELPTLFQRFRRVEGARGRTQEGTGIGLALVQELVRLHGGSVKVESELGRGSTFTVVVPLGKEHLPGGRIGGRALQATALGAAPFVEEALRWLPAGEAAAFAGSESPTAHSAPLSAGPRPRVLIADDNADMRDYLRRLLAAHYQVTAVADGQLALQAAQEHELDLIITDVMMPNLDGFGLLHALRAGAETSSLPVIMLSARAGEEARVEGLKAGADDYLTKPFSARELLARVEGTLALARARREAGAALRQSEERFRALVTASADVIFRMSPDWQQMRHLRGKEFVADTDEPTASWLDKYIHPDDQPRVTAAVEDAIRERRTFDFEHRIIRIDGSLGWTHSRAVPLIDAAGEIVEWMGMATDVTERRRAQERMAADVAALTRMHALSGRPVDSGGLPSLLQEIMDAAVAIMEAARGTFQLVAGGALRIVAHRGHAAPFLEFFANAEHRASACAQAMERGERVVVEDIEQSPLFAGTPSLDVLRAAGVRAVQSTPVMSRSGAPLGVLTTQWDAPHAPDEHDLWRVDLLARQAADLIEQAQAQEVLRDDLDAMIRLQKIGSLFIHGGNLQPLLGDILDAAITIARADFGVVQLLDRRSSELRIVVHRGFEPWWLDFWNSVQEGRGTCGVALGRGERVIVEDIEQSSMFEGPAREVQRRAGVRAVQSTPLTNRNGEQLGMLSTHWRAPTRLHPRVLHLLDLLARQMVDILERASAEEALRESDRRKNEFMATLSHELRNPLAPIRNSVHVLERAQPGGDQARRALAIIDRQSSHLGRLVDDLLDVTRISRGKIHLVRERIDVCEVARRTAEDFRSAFEKNGIALEVRLWPRPLIVDADHERLSQVIGNLLHNAAKFTPRDGRAEVVVERGVERAEAILRVRDDGAGMQPEIMERLFEAFVQADRTLDRSRGGLGLGLALVKGIVDLHGGAVAAMSDGPGRGSEFVVRLPLAGEAQDQVAFELPGPRCVPRRVLIIEDNVDAADSLREILEMSGHTVDVAYDGLEGLERARSSRPEFVLCDIGLPGMDGFAVARALRADPELGRTRLAALSGYALPEDVARAQEAGFDAHLAKPPKLTDIAQFLDGPP